MRCGFASSKPIDVDVSSATRIIYSKSLNYLNSGGTKSTGTTLSHLVKLEHLLNLRCCDILEHKLCDPVSWTNDKVVPEIVIEQNNLQLSLIIGIDDTCANPESVLYGETGARCDASIDSWRELNLNSSGHDDSMSRKKNVTL
jgi:hypothetical protein